ncbi:MAG: ABC transporter permease [Burkholderiales bacterium]|nr:ABC transporter permease [Burkholderiales bacterium]MDE2453537.1 ABC transporter permease [Burkholderiales bacterium]
MKRLPAVVVLALLALALLFPVDSGLRWSSSAAMFGSWLLLAGAALVAMRAAPALRPTLLLVALCLLGAIGFGRLPAAMGGGGAPGPGFWLAAGALLGLAAISVQRCAALEGGRWTGTLTAALFGLWVLFFWQVGVSAFQVPRVLLPSPSAIVASMAEHRALLTGDFVQTVLKSVLVGWLLGSALGFAVGVAIDRAPFLQRGLLPVASLTSTIPLVAVAPIMVMWFGFEWPSKAAVVVLMTFFPMLVSTLAGLQSAGRIERELMHSYAAGYFRTLLDLRLPCAVPFIMSALKINATLALIGAIVAEFFGSPTVGMGFRISTEAARMNMAVVWGTIVVASVTGSAAYALLVLLERRWAFWHPSVRSK